MDKTEQKELRKYRADVKKVKELSEQEMHDLFIKMEDNNDQFALEKLVKSHLNYVIEIAKKNNSEILPLNDKINEGNLGLLSAVKLYCSLGFRKRNIGFIDWIKWVIKKNIEEALVEQSRLNKIPKNKHSAINMIRRSYADRERVSWEASLIQEFMTSYNNVSQDEINDILIQ